MNILLFIIEIIFIAIFFILSIVLIPIGYLLRSINKDLSYRYADGIVRFVLKIVKIISLTKTNVIYDEPLHDETLFYISNHRGIFDIILLFPLIKGKCLIVAKDSLKKYPFISQWMDLIGCFFLDRKNIRSGFNMVIYCIDMLKSGISILIFPEGTRSKGMDYHDMLDFKEGCFAIPKKVNVKVVPIGIHDTSLIYERNKSLRCGENISIHFGKKYDVVDEKGIGEFFMNKVKELF